MRKIKRMLSLLMTAVFAFSLYMVTDFGQVKAEVTGADTVLTEFLNSGYNKSGIEIYDGSNEFKYIPMKGRKYYQGIVFKGGSDNGKTSFVTFNVENYSSISFTPGAVDDAGYIHWADLKIYRDNEWYRDIKYSVDDTCQEYSIDLTGVSILTFKYTSDHYYFCHAICDISLDGYKPSMTYSTPQYSNSADFVNSTFHKCGIDIYDGSENYFIQMNGKKYSNGLRFNGGSSSGKFASSSVNVENVDTLTFTVGHIDDTYLHDATLDIYKDNKFYYSMYLSPNDKVKAYKIDTSDASILRFKFTSNHYYFYFALTNFVLDENYDSITDGSYSNKNSIKDIDLLINKGDVNRTNGIDLYDVIEIAKYLLGTRTFNSDEMQLADYDENGKVDLYDAIGIAKYLLNNR